jgi:hypothetical protein
MYGLEKIWDRAGKTYLRGFRAVVLRRAAAFPENWAQDFLG